MPCKDHREALIAAAVSESVASQELGAHLEACAACRGVFREEQQLFAAIDAGVRGATSAEIPASLLPRVRARLDEQKVERFSWVKLGAVLAAACVVVSVAVWLRGPRRGSREPSPMLQAVVAPSAISSAPPVPASSVQTSEPSRRTPQSGRGRRQEVSKTRAREMPAVLVPTGRKEAIDAMLAALRNGMVKPETLLAEKSAQRTPDGELLPLRIAEIEIKPLDAVSPEAGPTGETTRF